MRDVSRRRLLKKTAGVGAAGAIGASPFASGCVGGATIGGGLKIGVLQPYQGVRVQRWGAISIWGFLSGLAHWYGQDYVPLTEEEIGGGTDITFETEDRNYEILIRDTLFQPNIGVNAAESLVVDEDVDILFGGANSSVVTRVLEQVAKETDTLYIAGQASAMNIVSDPDLCGRKIFRANENQAMEARAGAKYVAEETDTESIYLLGPDNIFGQSFVDTYSRALEEQGVEAVGERLVPSGFSEFRGVFENIDDEADAVAINFSGSTLAQFLPTFIEGNVSGAFDLRAYAPMPGELGLNLIAEVLESQLGGITEEGIEKANIGGLVSRYHWNQYDNPINNEFVPAFTETYGTLPALFTSGTFTVGSAIAQAVEATGSTNPDDIADEMYGMTVEETPKGENGYVFQEHNNQAKSPMTISKIVPNEEENWNAPIMPSEPVARVSADDAALPKDDPSMECDLTTE